MHSMWHSLLETALGSPLAARKPAEARIRAGPVPAPGWSLPGPPKRQAETSRASQSRFDVDLDGLGRHFVRVHGQQHGAADKQEQNNDQEEGSSRHIIPVRSVGLPFARLGKPMYSPGLWKNWRSA